MIRALMVTVAALMTLLLAGPAAAAPNLDALPGGGCPWSEGIESASASMSTVYINHDAYYVKGYENRAVFMQHLQSCGEADAAAAFEMWQRDRRRVGTTAVVGIIPALQPLWIGTGVFAVLAGQHKLQMLNALGR